MRAGLLDLGDLICSVDKQSVKGMEATEIMALLDGAPGTPVCLEVVFMYTAADIYIHM